MVFRFSFAHIECFLADKGLACEAVEGYAYAIVEYATKEQAQHASRMLDHRMLMGHHVAVLQVRKLAEADDAVQVALTQPFSGPDQKVVGKLKICLAPNRSLISHVVEVREAKQFTWEIQLPLMPRVPSIQHLLALFSTVGRIERAEYQYAGGVVIQFDTAETADAAICMTMP
ncbi:uncharacterized protein PV06_08668 [Exophiala oligosperma]|uniref:RRM domain-containing protein n=1 Tax=Exophiala oligosperma TaxID=215243 RepID=A0A0D2D8P2_9EURO|nr:uncharacterized protein PV06_08668 [Exophiala oligosperma]KIW38830.1 hypothetical protein PV06_08668 [Exophiala oligosperma]